MSPIHHATAEIASAAHTAQASALAQASSTRVVRPVPPIEGVKLSVGGQRQDLSQDRAAAPSDPAPTDWQGLNDDIGAVQTTSGTQDAPSRPLESVMSTLQSSIESQNEARRRVVDAAMAEHAAQRGRVQILRDPTAALLTQANVMPGTVLGLLQPS